MNLVDEGELLEHAFLLQYEVGLLAREGALKLLAGQQLLLDLLPSLLADLLVCCVGVVRIDEDLLAVVILEGTVELLVEMLPGKGLGTLAITSTVTGGDEIGHAARFHEGVVLDSIEEHLAELGHLTKAHSKEGSLGIATEVESIDETGTEGDDVLERAAHFGTGHVANVLDAEGWRVVKNLPSQLVCRRAKVGRQGRLAHLTEGHLGGNVGAHEDTALEVISHGLLDGAADENRILGVGAEVCTYLIDCESKRAKNK